MSVTFENKQFKANMDKLLAKAIKNKSQAINNVATEILRLSQFQVPHDKGELQNSGHVSDRQDESVVGYNKVYAARLHEHPEYKFQKGRKGKYLEDPIKTNLHVFKKYFRDILK